MLALAEWRGLPDRQVIIAMCLGIEAQARVALSLGAAHYGAGWHATATAGTFGAAVAASKSVPPRSLDVANVLTPLDGLAAKFSIPYCVAVALADSQVGLGDFLDEAVRRPERQELLHKVTVLPDPKRNSFKRPDEAVQGASGDRRQIAQHHAKPAGGFRREVRSADPPASPLRISIATDRTASAHRKVRRTGRRQEPHSSGE